MSYDNALYKSILHYITLHYITTHCRKTKHAMHIAVHFSLKEEDRLDVNRELHGWTPSKEIMSTCRH